MHVHRGRDPDRRLAQNRVVRVRVVRYPLRVEEGAKGLQVLLADPPAGEGGGEPAHVEDESGKVAQPLPVNDRRRGGGGAPVERLGVVVARRRRRVHHAAQAGSDAPRRDARRARRRRARRGLARRPRRGRALARSLGFRKAQAARETHPRLVALSVSQKKGVTPPPRGSLRPCRPPRTRRRATLRRTACSRRR